jgi:hypothetical protein
VSQPPEDHLKALWQGQDAETPAMTLQAIRALARNHAGHVRDKFLFGAILIAVEAVAFAPAVWRAPNNVARAGGVIILVGLAWMAWRMRQRWPSRLPDAKASVGTLIDFHRAELERQRTNYAWLLISAGPMICGMLVMVYGLRLARPNAFLVPFFSLLALWFAAAWLIQRRQARRTQEQLDEVDAMRASDGR